MKYHHALHRFRWAWPLALLGSGLANCNVNDPAPQDSGGEAGMSPNGGAPALEEPDAQVRICGVVPQNSECDPVTAAPCDILAGETCDYAIAHSRFQCFGGPNPVEPGGTCDPIANFCAAGASCNVELARCQRYCCQDSDCSEGACRTKYRKDGDASIGVCFDEFRGGSSPGGSGGEGGSAP